MIQRDIEHLVNILESDKLSPMGVVSEMSDVRVGALMYSTFAGLLVRSVVSGRPLAIKVPSHLIKISEIKLHRWLTCINNEGRIPWRDFVLCLSTEK